MKTWQGRFKKDLDKDADSFNASSSFDKRLFKQDVASGMAHTAALAKARIITAAEAKKITAGLKNLLKRGDSIDFTKYEDVHSAVEMELTKEIGDTGKKLHTGRSRNDLVATDTRLYLMDEYEEISDLLLKLMKAFVARAKENIDVCMPGYTHMQQAQIITAGHWFMAYFEMLKRDHGLLLSFKKRCSEMPLGSGALAGSNFALDRDLTASLLGFQAPCANSLDAVSDRDFVNDFNYFAAVTCMHLSRFAEEVIIYNTQEFGYIEIDDSFATGSSLMPQKKNPDIAELIRGKCAAAYGNLVQSLVMMKGLPLTYNKDLQEDKPVLFRGIDSIKEILVIAEKFIASLSFKRENLKKGLKGTFMYSVDVADYLVTKGVPFREAHEITGRLVAYCVDRGISFEKLKPADLAKVSPKLERDVMLLFIPEKSVAMKKTKGSPSPESVKDQIKSAEAYIKAAVAK